MTTFRTILALHPPTGADSPALRQAQSLCRHSGGRLERHPRGTDASPQVGIDLVVMDVAMNPEGQRIVLGTDQWNLLHAWPVPVLLVTPFSEHLAPRMLIAIDAFDDLPEPASFNDFVLRVGKDLANVCNASLEVAAVFPFLPKAGNFHHLAPAVAAAERGYLHAFEARASSAGIPSQRQHLLRGEPGPMLLHLAARERFGTVAVGVHPPGGQSDVLADGTAGYVLRNARCDVLLIPSTAQAATLSRAA